MIDVSIVDGRLHITADMAEVGEGEGGCILVSTRGGWKSGVVHSGTGKALVVALNVHLEK